MKQVVLQEPEPREQSNSNNRYNDRSLDSLLLDEGVTETRECVETRRAGGNMVKPVFAVLKRQALCSVDKLPKDLAAWAASSLWIRELG